MNDRKNVPIVDGAITRCWSNKTIATLERLGVGAVEVDRFHRAHATVELAIRDLKASAGGNHMPSGHFYANGAWLAAAVLAHNLIRWTAQLGDITPPGRLVVARTILVRLLAVPARLVNRSGRRRLRMPARWPWADVFTRALDTIRALPAVPL